MEYTPNAAMALELSKRSASRHHQGYVGTEHILLGLLQEGEGVAAKILSENKVEAYQLEKLIFDLIEIPTETLVKERGGFSPKAAQILEDAEGEALRYHMDKIGTEHILLALLKDGENVAARLLNTLGTSTSKLYTDILVAMGEDVSQHKHDLNKKKKKGSILEQYSRDLTALAAEGELDPCIGRDDEIIRTIQILSRRTKNNPCLLGEPGVGKSAIVEGLAQRIVSGDVPASVQGKRLLTLDMAGMVAGSKYRGEFEERIKRVINEVLADKNIILFMDELHTLIGAGGAEGALDASNILKPSLARGELQMIGATTIAEYRKYIEKDAALERRFQPITVEEPTQEEAIKILKGVVHKYEEHHDVSISDEAIEAAVKFSERYINDRNLPDKAIDLIDEASAAVRLNIRGKSNQKEALKQELEALEEQLEEAFLVEDYNAARDIKRSMDQVLEKMELASQKSGEGARLVVGEEDIASVVALWTKIPVKKLAEKESERLLALDKTLHERVIGQEEAVQAVTKAIRRGRVGLQDPNRPIGSFLFLGPTGVGKTELSKALAQAMFGSDSALIRVDMSEYMESHSVAKMIGSPPGYVGFEDGGQLSEKIRRHPYSVVLFDEIEKAHPDIFNVLLQVLDDGHITDAKGRKVSFKNTILIMTSNAGASRIVEPKNLGFAAKKDDKQDYEKMKSNVMEEVKRIFKPEFINRIDEIMVFHALTKKELMEITALLCNNLAKRCMAQMEIRLAFSEALKEHLVDKHSDPKMGARPLKRAIQNLIEDKLAEEVLSGKIQAGDRVQADFEAGEVVFKNALLNLEKPEPVAVGTL
ncbi:MAG: ATP-dependent Clp protease ATP-binding subunit [Lachnospiraceae bacterium]|nr:ATP-dependent Clp protease ATP-binding subunit [Lachnospiraceae bacterium]